MYLTICTTTDNIDIANKISEFILNEKYSPCIQIIPNVSSKYIWKDKIKSAIEYRIDIKTNSLQKDKIINIIKDIHNYDAPEIISSEIKILDNNYENWFKSNIRKE